MTQPVPMTELWRGPLLESLHLGHAVICDDSGQIVRSWGDPDAVIYPPILCQDDTGAALDHLGRCGKIRVEQRASGAGLCIP